MSLRDLGCDIHNGSTQRCPCTFKNIKIGDVAALLVEKPTFAQQGERSSSSLTNLC